MTNMAMARERPIECLNLAWTPPDHADEQAIAGEVLSALFSFTASWLEPLALETRYSCYDREISSETKGHLERPFHVLVRDPALSDVRIWPMYNRSVESRTTSLTNGSVESWVKHALEQTCDGDSRNVVSLRELDVRASQISLPSGWTDGNELALECYAGTVQIPLEWRGGTAWVSAPPMQYAVDQPVEIKVENWAGVLQFTINVYWSPWVGEHARQGSPLAEGIARLTVRGWTPSTD